MELCPRLADSERARKRASSAAAKRQRSGKNVSEVLVKSDARFFGHAVGVGTNSKEKAFDLATSLLILRPGTITQLDVMPSYLH